MEDKNCKFSIVFKELDRLTEESNLRLTIEELTEYEAIRNLREIVHDIQNQTPNYVAST